VLIEKGTPAGFKIIADARKKILQSTAKFQIETNLQMDKQDNDTIPKLTNYGAHVVAPVRPRPSISATETSKKLEKLTHDNTINTELAKSHIERMIIPKSQGKVPYRDARKAMWGDLFPHSPKKPAERRNIGIDKKYNKEEIYIMNDIEYYADEENLPRRRNVPRKN
ncbi:3224_t:CDS:2, partial [Racocetra fulgida]